MSTPTERNQAVARAEREANARLIAAAPELFEAATQSALQSCPCGEALPHSVACKFTTDPESL